MGRVYLAMHATIGRLLAVKVLVGEHAVERGGAERLFREAQSAAAIGHPNIIDIIDVGISPLGDPYLVMEYLDGEDLSTTLERQAPLSLAAACGVLEPILLALGAAHAKGIVHRDLKPGNIFVVQRQGAPATVKLIDFGIAKLLGPERDAEITQNGALLGTPSYMSPEQARGAEQVDARSDLYSVGVVFYQMLMRRLPFDGANYNETLFKIVNDPTPEPDSKIADLEPAALELLRRALCKKPSERHASASAMLEAFAALGAWRHRRAAFEALVGKIPPPSAPVVVTQPLDGEAATQVSPRMSDPPGGGPDTDAIVTRTDGPLIGQAGSGRRDVARDTSSPSREQPSAAFRHVPWLVGAGVVALGFLQLTKPVAEAPPGVGPRAPALSSGVATSVLPPASAVTITLEGVPPSARTFFDGQRVLANPFNVSASSAVTSIRVEMDGHEAFLATVVPSQDTTVRVILTPTEPGSATAEVSTDGPPQLGQGAPRSARGRRPPAPKTPASRGQATSPIGKTGRDSMYSEKFE
jgi:serine/threonine-protein kinase